MKLTRHFLFLFMCIFVCGIVSVCFGRELTWDLANYHFYSPYALLYRQGEDVWPTTYIHQFLNPTVDLLSYFLIRYLPAWLAEFTLGALSGINVYLLFLISLLFINKNPYRISLALLLTVLGMYGPTVVPGIGSFQNDNVIAIFVLAFVYLQLRAFEEAKINLFLLAGAAFVLGLGVGLKLTAGVFMIGGAGAIMLMPLPKRQLLQMLMIYAVSALLGIMVSAGYWMLLLWQHYHNPLFPFFNKFFHAEQFAVVNWRDLRFLPRSNWEFLFYPFYFSFNGERVSDLPFMDVRFAIVYVLFLLSVLKWLWQRTSASNAICEASRLRWLFVFFIVSYITWQYYFSIARYIAALEMLAPLVIYLLMQRVFTNETVRFAGLTFLFYGLFILCNPQPMIRMPWYRDNFFNIRLPSTVSAASPSVVLMSYTAYVGDRDPRPHTYLIPSFPDNWHFVGVPFWQQKYLFDKQSEMLIRDALSKQNKDIYLLTSQLSMPEFTRAMKKFGLERTGRCAEIMSDRQYITFEKVLLCKVKHLAHT